MTMNKSVRLCSECKIGIPHWMTDGHDREFVRCGNCGRTVKLPYACFDWADIWNNENQDGIEIPYSEHAYATANIIQLIPGGEFERDVADGFKRVDAEIKGLCQDIMKFDKRLDQLEKNHALVRCDEPLTDITMGQYDLAVRVSNAVQKLMDEYMHKLPAEMVFRFRRALMGVDEPFEDPAGFGAGADTEEKRKATFEKGKTYRDAVGRKWKVVKVIHHGDYDILLVKRRFRTEIAFTEPDVGNTQATILFNGFGWTTIYDEEEKE